ncbi:MAG TPA: ADP-forming succinate--CoA ligase subunit beta [Candidatus Sulfotelmatobacter sp.]|nr:ADP-forming succinate--CoA ligase subunit beta [Candidatus Sulfotelmatobacter sp.]
MKIHEYQAKALLAEFGVPVPRGGVAATPGEARAVAEGLGGRAVVKAQIHAGGRGKGGGVKLAAGPDEAEAHARAILGMQLVTPQTGPGGQKVQRVLVEEAMPIARELYLGMLLDRKARLPVIMGGPGGMEIEELAREKPEAIVRVHVDPTTGFQGYHARRLALGFGLAGDQAKAFAAMLRSLFRLFEAKDCSLVEVNPLVVLQDGRLLPLDAKITFDDNGLFRHPEVRGLRDLDEESPLEVEASKFELNYIKLDGTVGCMVNGAGLAMATMDIIQRAGAMPANFLDVGGGATAEQVENAFRILMSDANVRAVFINVFGGILRCDLLAQGVIEAVRKLGVKVPVVIRMEGTNVAEGRRLLEGSGLNLTTAADMWDGAQKAARAVRAAA